MFETAYKKIVIQKPKFTLLILTILLFSIGFFAKDFQLDASSDTLLLENDPDLKYLREINKKYGTQDYLVLTYTPQKQLLEKETIKHLTNLKNDLLNLEWTNSVITVLDVPLLKNSDDPLAERIINFKTLLSEDVNKKRGFEEILNSPIYREYVISKDGKTSGIVIYLKEEKRLKEYIKIKDDYYDKSLTTSLNKIEKQKYNLFIKEYENYKNLYNLRNHQNINEIREVISKYNDSATIHLGGIPMIADDMMTFI